MKKIILKNLPLCLFPITKRFFFLLIFIFFGISDILFYFSDLYMGDSYGDPENIPILWNLKLTHIFRKIIHLISLFLEIF